MVLRWRSGSPHYIADLGRVVNKKDGEDGQDGSPWAGRVCEDVVGGWQERREERLLFFDEPPPLFL